ncbi:(Fe-S)-binding protein [candidate division WOR-3 bacterium]|nr:(Fe-S)-binding protein [candidate division WOR-3 bacterium]MCK4575242.1 (Fe-S)-binding protein [candidate division WOR-3 bacterium]
MLLSGAIEKAKKQAKRVEKEIEESGVDVVVTPCAHCYTTIKAELPKLTGRKKRNYEVLHLSQFIHKLIKDGKVKLKNPVKAVVCYHDPCYIGRKGDGIYDEPREVIKAIPGVKFKEIEFSHDVSSCCGGGGLVRAYLPLLSIEVSKDKIEKQFIPAGAEVLVSSCPFCYQNLYEGGESIENIEVMDIIELLLKSME